MQIIKSGFRKGFVKLKIDTEDDLWYLKNIVEEDDFVKARTMRSLFIERDGRKLKVGKKPMFIKIQVEKIDFQEHVFQLRLTGKIVEGPEDVQIGSYHTIEVKVGTILTIFKKEWKKYHVEKIKKAQVKIPDVLIAAVDSSHAVFGLMKKSRIEIISEFRNPFSTQQEEKLPEFYKKIATEISKYSEKVNKIILAGPGFTKEHVQKIIQKDHPETSKKLIIGSVSSATKAGINEIIKKGTLDRVIKDSEIIKESKIIQEFFEHLKKEDGFSVYGFEQIKQADEMGAISIFLVSDEKIREDKIENLAKEVERKGGRVEIISKEHDLGEQFFRMGGLGAILRFKVY